MQDSLYLTTREAAIVLGYSSGTLRNWRSKGEGPGYLKLETGTVRYRAKDIIKWMEGKTND